MAGRYITQGRMRRAKWEDSMANRRLKSDFGGKKHPIEHTNCSCGSMECLAVPTIRTRGFTKNYSEFERVELTPAQADRTLKRVKKRNGPPSYPTKDCPFPHLPPKRKRK